MTQDAAPPSSLAVDGPAIDTVLHLPTGQLWDAAALIGSDYGGLMQLRLDLRTAIHRQNPDYVCPLCGVAVYLVSQPDGRHFSFRHHVEEGNCPARTRNGLSELQILARKYDGAKEGDRHRQTKAWILQSLAADPAFSEVQSEIVWKSASTGRWRRPDVRARFGDIPVAFEVQLSTTFLRVVAERRAFYLDEGGLLFWVFDSFDDDDRQMIKDDVFYNNNRNAFVVNSATVESSLRASSFHLQCFWADPHRPEDGALKHRLVRFQDLTLDLPNQRAYAFDFDGEATRLYQQQVDADTVLRGQFERYWLEFTDTREENLPEWRTLRSALAKRDISVPTYPRMIGDERTLINALYSARTGRPVGFGFKKLIQVAHMFPEGDYKQYLRTFRHSLDVYDRSEQIRHEDRTGKWRARVKEYLPRLKANDPDYDTKIEFPELLKFLFPELHTD